MENIFIQVNFVHALLGLLVLVATLGAAWGSIKTSIQNIQKTLDELLRESKDARLERTQTSERVTRLEAKESYSTKPSVS